MSTLYVTVCLVCLANKIVLAFHYVTRCHKRDSVYHLPLSGVDCGFISFSATHGNSNSNNSCARQSISLTVHPTDRPTVLSSVSPSYGPVHRSSFRSTIQCIHRLTDPPSYTALQAHSHTILYRPFAFARPYRRPNALTSLRPIVHE